MLYFQTPLIDKLPAKQISDKEIKKKALEYIKKCNESRKQVKEDKNGVFIITNIEETKISVLNAQQKIPKEF
jgi:flagellar basal body rod protein FlgF